MLRRLSSSSSITTSSTTTTTAQTTSLRRPPFGQPIGRTVSLRGFGLRGSQSVVRSFSCYYYLSTVRRHSFCRFLLPTVVQQQQQLARQQPSPLDRNYGTRLQTRTTLLDHQVTRSYTKTSLLQADDGGGGAAAATSMDTKQRARQQQRLQAQQYNQKRAAYQREVSQLRRKYAEQVAQQKAQDLAEVQALQKELHRKFLERQRRKNIKSAQHALHQDQVRHQRAQEFQQHLRVMQERREVKEKLYQQARQLVIDELEQEAPLWLTTVEEVEAAFTPEAEQLLWTRPGGVLGAPSPSLDSHFWQFETHTWHMDKTYKSQRQVLLEQLQEQAYEEANVNKSFWTPERIKHHEELEEKAKLRAMVHSSGRLELLKRQRQMLMDDVEKTSTSEEGLPKPTPVPNLRMLQNQQAMEKEGAKLLLEDPTKFFVFDATATSNIHGDERVAEKDRAGGSNDTSSSSGYSGPSLGAPIGLRDQLREGSHQNQVFPSIIGRFPKPDTRTEREKKQQEREERMFAAAQAEAHQASMGSGPDMDIELAAQQQTLEDLEPDLNYDDNDWDWQDDEWKKGLDPIADADALNTPREQRYTDDDIDWVSGQLDATLSHLEQQFKQDLENLKRSIESEAKLESGHEHPFSEDSLEAALLALSESELLELSDLDDRYAEGMTDEELREAGQLLPGLSHEQLLAVLQRNRATDSR